MVFLPAVVILYFLTPYKYRWGLLLAASYYFYMCWKLEYIVLIIVSTMIDYVVARKIFESTEKRKRQLLLMVSLFVNLGILFSFKYYNFVSENINEAFQAFNIMGSMPFFDVLLPVGISFYTFQTLSYTIDVYNGKLEPERHLGYFALYVSFFPQLVAGPIERPGRLLPQLHQKASLSNDNIKIGLQWIALGLFKKVVIADRLALYVNTVYADPEKFGGFPVIIGTVFFAYQIYCDFSGYSDIAIGSAKILGIDLMKNFNSPYHSRSVAEFWGRWHISLSTWFRDYLYIPLGGNRVSKLRWVINIFVVFVVSGFWHGANWTFILWGALHGAYMIIPWAIRRVKDYLGMGPEHQSKLRDLRNLGLTFLAVLLSWVFFRAESIGHAFTVLGSVPDITTARLGVNVGMGTYWFFVSVISIIVLETFQVLQAKYNLRTKLETSPVYVRWGLYYALAVAILLFGAFNKASQFIYFQF